MHHFLVQPGIGLVSRLNKAHATLHQFGDFSATKIRSPQNDRLRKVDAATVAERERGLVQHSWEQLPNCVAGPSMFSVWQADPLQRKQLEQVLDIELSMVQQRVSDAAKGQFLSLEQPATFC